jgi:polysaccharide deacetylase family protein (PEP-CTERM system associated)
MLNVMTVDVEDWFHVQAFSHIYPVSEWNSQRTRIIANVIKTLEILHEHRAKATFFILGWVAQRFPEIVALIHDRGHEIASHSQYHRLVYNLSPDEFREDLRQSILHIEQAANVTVRGYRAPSFSVRPQQKWIWTIFREFGIEFDSSVFPVMHDTYGTPSAPRFPYKVKVDEGSSVLEIPPSTIRMAGMNVPVAGGGYLRMFPYWFTKRAIRKLNSEGHPAIVYFHPWELDVHQKRLDAGLKSRLRHYTNLSSFESKLHRLLAEFEFSTISDVVIGGKKTVA